MKRSIVMTSAAVFAAAGLSVGTAGAAEPANTGCYGESTSALASEPGSSAGFGHATADFTRFLGSPASATASNNCRRDKSQT